MARATRLPASDIEEIFRRFQAADPAPKGELKSVNAFTFLVAVVLSAQATDEGVNRATGPLFAVADTPAKDGGAGRRDGSGTTSRPSVSTATRPRT